MRVLVYALISPWNFAAAQSSYHAEITAKSIFLSPGDTTVLFADGVWVDGRDGTSYRFMPALYDPLEGTGVFLMKENLSFGDILSTPSSAAANGLVEYYVYDDDPTFGEEYGYLYERQELLDDSACGDWELPISKYFGELTPLLIKRMQFLFGGEYHGVLDIYRALGESTTFWTSSGDTVWHYDHNVPMWRPDVDSDPDFAFYARCVREYVNWNPLWSTGETTLRIRVAPIATTTYTISVDSDFGVLVDSITIFVGSCPAPSSLMATAAPNGAVLQWSHDPFHEKYRLEGREVGSVAFRSKNVNSASVAIVGLEASTSYEWKVQARCLNGEDSPESDLSTFSTPALREMRPNDIKYIDVLGRPAPRDGSHRILLSRSGSEITFIEW